MSNPVPVGWSARLFSDAVTLVYGKSPKEILENDGAYPVIGTGGITGLTNSFLHEGKTTVIGRKGTINKPSYIETKFWAIDTTYYVTNYKRTDPKWFFYLLQDIDLTKYNEASGVPSLNRDTLYAIPYISPPLPEQQKIAKILTSVDEVIEKTQAQIDKLKDLKTGMMQELLTQGVGVDGKPHTEFKDSPVGRIPKAWTTVCLSEVGKWKGGGTPSKANKDFWKGTIPWVSPKDMKSDVIYQTEDYITEEAVHSSSTNLVSKNSLLMVVRSGILKHTLPIALAGSDLALNQDMKALSTSKACDVRYIFHYLQANNFKVLRATLKAGNTVESIDFSEFGKYAIPFPSLAEQKLIAGAVDSVLNRINARQAKLNSLVNMKKALMQDLLTGKVRVAID
ncbi:MULTISPECIES: restriction endonuclease subunit S [Shewanella]|uniref:restriction endonuclease subunit S n=1 Tax=Shewanella TaxID=22 RepID=UPI003006CB54